MSSPLPPDPYLALGLAKDASATQVKSTYRKLVLKCHPDKVADPLLKTAAVDEFHRIQQAYEILGDDDRRKRYDAQVQLAELRRNVMEKQKKAAPCGPDAKVPHRTPATNPAPPTPMFQGSDRFYEERKPSKVYDSENEYFPNSRTARKHDDYETTAKKSAPRDDKSRLKAHGRSQKEAEKFDRADRRRTKDKETRRERATKYSYVEDDSASDDVRRRDKYDSDRQRDDIWEYHPREEAASDRRRDFFERERVRDGDFYATQSRKGREHRTANDYEERLRRDSSRLEDAKNYIDRTVRAPARPSAGMRSASMREGYIVDRSRDGPPVIVRRVSARPLTRDPSPPRMSSRHDRDLKYSIPETQEYYTDEVYAEPEAEHRTERRPPNMQTSNSSPAAFRTKVRVSPIRSQSLRPEYDDIPHPQILRSETMPDIGRRRRDTSEPLKGSHLRETDFVDGLPTPSTTPESVEYSPSPSPIPTARYRYASHDMDDEGLPGGHRASRREPFTRDERRFTRSPSPITQTHPTKSRYVSGSQMPRTPQPYRDSAPIESPVPRRTPTRPSLDHRGSSKTTPLYAEVPKAYTTKYEYAEPATPRTRQGLDADKVRYTKRPSPVARTSSTRKTFWRDQAAGW